MPMTLTNFLAMDLHLPTEMDNYCLHTYKLKTYFACYCISTFHLSPPASMFTYLLLLLYFIFTMSRLGVCSRLATQKMEHE